MSEANKLPISVILVARNEERNLPRCLASVATWVSEIIVLLNNTTDRSEEIARSYGAYVEHHPWLGFRDTKNVALSRASQPWVILMDADECVTQGMVQAINSFFNGEVHEKYQGVSFPRCTWFLGRWIRHGDWYPDHVLRLFKRNCSCFGGLADHEKIEVQGKTTIINEDLLHYSFPSLASQLIKINVYSDYFLDRQLKKGKGWSLLNNLFRPSWRFFRCYILRLGFLDGFPGLYIAIASSFATFLKYSRLYEHKHPCTPPMEKQSNL